MKAKVWEHGKWRNATKEELEIIGITLFLVPVIPVFICLGFIGMLFGDKSNVVKP